MSELKIGGSNMTVELRGDTIYAEANTGNKQWVAVITDTHPKYNYDREFVAYQKPKTSNRDSGTASIEDGAVIERVRYTHSGKNRKDQFYQLVDGEAYQIDEADVEAALDGEIIPDVAPEPREIDDDLEPAIVESHECEECGDTFDSAHGLAVHVGMVHDNTDDTDTDTDASEKAETTQPVVADGGQPTADLNPTKLEYDLKTATKDSTNSRTNHLGRVAGTDVWLAYRTWLTGDGEQYAIKGIGEWSIEPTTLNTDTVAESIQDEAARIVHPDDPDADVAAIADELTTRADELAEQLETAWQWGVDQVLGEAIYEGSVGVSGTEVWAGHVQEALYHEADDVMRTEVEVDDVDGLGLQVLRQALSDGLSTHRQHRLKKHCEYVGRLAFETDKTAIRALELQQRGGLPEQTAKTAARKEAGMQSHEIARELDVHQSTVSRHLQRARDRIDEGRWLVENTDLSG